MKGLLGIEDVTRDEVQAILDRARHFQVGPGQRFRKFDLLKGRMVVNLFFENSTRTRTSFELAAKGLGADAVSITAQASSVAKGESLVDTLNTLGAMRPDAIVMHPGPINRGREISSEVADSQRSAILNQVENGISVRMAVLERVLGGEQNAGPAH